MIRHSTSRKVAALRWVGSMAPPIDDLTKAERTADTRAEEPTMAPAVSVPMAAKRAAHTLAQEQAARMAAEERAKQEALRVESLTAVLQRAEQRARTMDLAIAEKSQRLAAAEAQLSRLVFGEISAESQMSHKIDSVRDVDQYLPDDSSEQTLLAQRNSLSPPHRLADGTGISMSFQRSLAQLGVEEDTGSTSEELGSPSGPDDSTFDPWQLVLDVATGSPPGKRRSRSGSQPSRLNGIATQQQTVQYRQESPSGSNASGF